MILPPATNPIHLFGALEVVPVCRFLKPAVLPPALTRLLTFRLGTMALPITGSGIGMIHLPTMQAFTTVIFSHGPLALREENPRKKKTHLQNRWARRRTEEEIIFECFLKKTQSAKPPLSNRQVYSTFILALTSRAIIDITTKSSIRVKPSSVFLELLIYIN
jgi:hypothetical protein